MKRNEYKISTITVLTVRNNYMKIKDDKPDDRWQDDLKRK